jgi:predicted 3-demethylubiquinone-9 3-methyltransferase (glyoxalase superfamily)
MVKVKSQKIIPFLWFDDHAEEAVRLYTSLFPNSKILSTARYDENGAKASGRPVGSILTIDFELCGQRFTALNGGPIFKFNESISFIVNCKTQKEIDYYWKGLSAFPKAEQCGWLKDKFGLSWQIIPEQLGELISKDNSGKVMQKMLKMKKIIVKDLNKS